MPDRENNPAVSGEYVLDSYALLTYLGAELGGGRVEKLLESARDGRCHLYMCVVNLGEAMYIVERERGLPRAQETLARIDELPIEIVDANRAITMAAAHLKASCPIAYADCFAAALAQVRGAPLVTGDPEFLKIGADSSLHTEWLT
ncbi:MAG: type II toxin-antitoxin system VapC family toxin [Chloroflexota bacterium]